MQYCSLVKGENEGELRVGEGSSFGWELRWASVATAAGETQAVPSLSVAERAGAPVPSSEFPCSHWTLLPW